MIFTELIPFQSPKQFSRHRRGWSFSTGREQLHTSMVNRAGLTKQRQNPSKRVGQAQPTAQCSRQIQDCNTGSRSNQEIALPGRVRTAAPGARVLLCMPHSKAGHRHNHTAAVPKQNRSWRLTLNRAWARGCGSRPQVKLLRAIKASEHWQQQLKQHSTTCILLFSDLFLLFKDCLPSKIRQRQESHFPLIWQLWHTLVCQLLLTHLHLSLSWILFACSTLHCICL